MPFLRLSLHSRQSTTCWALARRTVPPTRQRSGQRTFSRKWTKTTTANWPRTSSWRVACRTRSCPRCWHLKCRVSMMAKIQSLIRSTITRGRRRWETGSGSLSLEAVEVIIELWIRSGIGTIRWAPFSPRWLFKAVLIDVIIMVFKGYS